MVVRSQAVLGGWLQSTTANHLATAAVTAAEAANLGSAEAAKMPLSHKEGLAARSSEIAPRWAARQARRPTWHTRKASSLKRIDLTFEQRYRIFGSVSLKRTCLRAF